MSLDQTINRRTVGAPRGNTNARKHGRRDRTAMAELSARSAFYKQCRNVLDLVESTIKQINLER